MKNWALPAILVVLIAGVAVGLFLLQDYDSQADVPTGAEATAGQEREARERPPAPADTPIPDKNTADSRPQAADQSRPRPEDQPAEQPGSEERNDGSSDLRGGEEDDSSSATSGAPEGVDKEKAARENRLKSRWRHEKFRGKTLDIPESLRKAQGRSGALLQYPVDRAIPAAETFLGVGRAPQYVLDPMGDDPAPGEVVVTLSVSCYRLEDLADVAPAKPKPVDSCNIEVWNDKDPTVWLARTNNPVAARICMPFRVDAIWFVRASNDELVGTTVLSKRGFGRFGRIDGNRRPPREGVGVEYTAKVTVAMIPRAVQSFGQVVVRDQGGKPIDGALALCGAALLARSGDTGRLELPDVELPMEWLPPDKGIGGLGRVTVHAPGYLPGFFTMNELRTRGGADVVLIREFQMTFSAPVEERLLPLYVVGNGTVPLISAIPGDGEVMAWVAATERQARSLKREWPKQPGLSFLPEEGSPFGLSFATFVEALTSLGIDNAETYATEYAYWYTDQSEYYPETGKWTVALPYPGRFYINVSDRRAENPELREASPMLPYLDLAIDATDPKNPQGYL
ncbi:MAG: hypothetical protein OEY28_13110, partial [Nitrospira sp.]|nr:hypothetical protein [Nitrospira sp.]